MSDPGLSHRLSQRSRRAGLMIGVSMVLTIAFCAVAFTVLYTALDGLTTDFVSSSDESPTTEQQAAVDLDLDLEPTQQSSQEEQPADTSAPNDQESIPTPTSEPEIEQAEDAEDEVDGFNPDFQLRNSASINLREGPSTSTSIVDTLPPSTPLEYLNEDAPATAPGDGDRWMMFRTEDGLEGWVREIDVTDYVP